MNKQGLLVIGILASLFLIADIFPDAASQKAADKRLYFAVIVLLLVVFIALKLRKKSDKQKVNDIFLVLSVILLIWEIFFAKLALLDPFLFPSPARVFLVFQSDFNSMLRGLISSLRLLLLGYFLALSIAIPLGLWIGWRKRIFEVAYPVAKAVAPIPPTVYLPYSIVLLPTFSASSIFVIFIGAFWPIFVGTVYGVFSIDQRTINSARTLGLREHCLLRRIVFPAAMPSIFSGALIALILSFITLTVAEMIGATSGLGWYIEYHHQFANYDKVIAGMIFTALVVIGVMQVFDRIQRYYLRWQSTV
jgi:NitT/TauT family transport system permease protein